MQHADEAYSLGAGTVADTYLNQDKIFEIIKKSGAEAVHPGYGFLSENPDFSARCAKEGVVFLGPTEEQMVSFGLKHKAREIAGRPECLSLREPDFSRAPKRRSPQLRESATL